MKLRIDLVRINKKLYYYDFTFNEKGSAIFTSSNDQNEKNK